MQPKYKDMHREIKEKEQWLSGCGSRRDINSVGSRDFPGEKRRRESGEHGGGGCSGGYKRRLDSDSEYDSEMDDFIDKPRSDAKVDISAEIRNIFGCGSILL